MTDERPDELPGELTDDQPDDRPDGAPSDPVEVTSVPDEAPESVLDRTEADVPAMEVADAGVPAKDLDPVPSALGWRRSLKSLLTTRLTAAGLAIALLIGLLGFALIAQVKTNDSSSTLSSDRPDDLVRILSDLDSRKDRLSREIASLQQTQRQLNSGAESKQAALDAAKQRADELGILAGTLPAEGPGIVVELIPTKSPIDAVVVLDAVEELRGAGAEAMQITGADGTTVRIIASTWFVDGNGGIVVSGAPLNGTLTITVIGDAQTMQTAFTIPGGVDDSVQQNGGTVLVQQPGTVRVTALAPASTLKYAHPVS